MEILSITKDIDVWFLMLPVAFGVFWLGVGLFLGIHDKKKFQTLTCSIFIVVVLISTISYCVDESKKHIVKVLVTEMDQVDTDKYEVIENEGKIVTLKEK